MKTLLTFAITIFIGYAQTWGPTYLNRVIQGQIKNHGSIRQYEEPCSQIGGLAPTSKSNFVCKTQYRIPKSVWYTANSEPNGSSSAIGLGYIIWATQVFCGNSELPAATFGDSTSPGRMLDTFNSYQVIRLLDFSCNSDLIVKVWSDPSYRRFGHMDAPIITGSESSIAKAKTFFDFFRFPLLLVLTAFFVGIYSFNLILLKLFHHKDSRSSLEVFDFAWIGYALAYSGIVSTLFPPVGDLLLASRLGNGFAVLAILGSSLVILRDARKTAPAIRHLSSVILRKIPQLRVSFLEIATIAYAASPYFAQGVGPIYVGAGVIFSILGILVDAPVLIALSLCSISDGLKVFMVGGLPFSMMLLIFVLINQGQSFLARMRRAIQLLDGIRWSKDYVAQSDSGKSDVNGLMVDLANRFEVQQISYVMPDSAGNSRIYVCKKTNHVWAFETIYSDTVPPAFAHVLSTRESLWHVEANSVFTVNLRKGEIQKYKYGGRYFTVIPLLENGSPVGAISMTSYPEPLSHDEIARLEFETVVNLVVPLISRGLSGQKLSTNTEWITRCSHLAKAIRELDPNKMSYFQDVTNLIADELNCGLFLGKLDPITRQIHLLSVSGYPDDIKEAYLAFRFYAVSHNEQGPMPLAVNRKKTVMLPEISWIKGVLHPQSIALAERFETRSCAAVPILAEGESWGVIWIESKHSGYFTIQSEPGLTQLRSSIEDSLAKMKLKVAHERVKEALAGFVPEHILPKMLAGDSAREEEIGYLLMADMKDSTKISRRFGAEKWTTFTKELCPKVEKVAADFGYKLQVVIWDAFYFTLESEKSNLHVQQTIVLARKLNDLFNQECHRVFNGDLGEVYLGDRARFCLVYGDTTRDLKGSLTANWTIVGSTMASVSKLEQTCKSYEGLFFSTQSVFKTIPITEWSLLPQKARSSEDDIYLYKGLLIERSDQIQKKEAA